MKKETAISKINPLVLKGICHRGLHNEQYSENGLNAFKNAINHNMAFEFDVHLTKDNQLVVIHDSDTRRMTGKEGIIEDLTLEQIKNNYRLTDGEQIPTLKEVLDLVNETVPVVLELKVFRKNYKNLSKEVEKAISVIKDKKNLMLISFDPRALLPFKNKGFIRQLLVAKAAEYTWAFRIFFEGADLEFDLLREKRYAKYARKHFTNIWTIENQKTFDEYALKADTVTFQTMDFEYVKKYYSDF